MAEDNPCYNNNNKSPFLLEETPYAMLKNKIENFSYYKRAKATYNKYERLAIPAFLLAGFIVDVITFKSIDIILAFSLLGVHLLIAGAAIAYINIYDETWIHVSGKIKSFLRFVAPFAMQFSFGALLSASFIFYSFSGSLLVSWPLISVILLLLIANEIFKKYYLRPTVQVSVYYFLIFSLSTLVFPFIFRSINPWLFVVAGVFSLLCIYLYIYAVAKVHDDFNRKKPLFTFWIIVIFVSMNALYVFNRIPPVPLTLNEIDVYHHLERNGGEYIVKQQKESMIDKFIPGRTLHMLPHGRLYIFASIFAPDKLNTTIVHHWQRYNPQTKTWESKNKFSYSISGGRSDGYRGFSTNTNLEQGKWRVFVETQRGQVMGKITFIIEHTTNQPEQILLIK